MAKTAEDLANALRAKLDELGLSRFPIKLEGRIDKVDVIEHSDSPSGKVVRVVTKIGDPAIEECFSLPEDPDDDGLPRFVEFVVHLNPEMLEVDEGSDDATRSVAHLIVEGAMMDVMDLLNVGSRAEAIVSGAPPEKL